MLSMAMATTWAGTGSVLLLCDLSCGGGVKVETKESASVSGSCGQQEYQSCLQDMCEVKLKPHGIHVCCRR